MRAALRTIGMAGTSPAMTPRVRAGRSGAGAPAVLLERLHRGNGQFIDADVDWVVSMALHPMPGDVVAGSRLVEFPPEILVLHRLVVGRAPAASLPVVHPLRNALAHILGIREQIDRARALKRI